MLNWLRCYQNSMAKINHFAKTEKGGERGEMDWRTNKRKQPSEIETANPSEGG